MRRYGKFFGILAIGLATMLTLADFAEARRASGGFGSRGTRTFQAPAATRTAPAPAAPIERTMTPQSQATRPAAAPNAQNPAGRTGGLFGGLAGGLMGGLLMGGLFGMLMGSGFGGGFGFLGLLLQGVLIFFLVRFAMRMFANRQPSLSGAGASPSARNDAAGGPGFQIPKIGGLNLGGGSSASSAPRRPSASADEIGIGQQDLQRFEGLLKEMQAAYANEDYASLRRITTPEAMSYLAEELSENATKGVKNEVRDVHLVQGDVSESWREGNVDFATVAMRYESIDVLRDRTTGNVVSGDPDNVSESTEIWTFVRRPGTDWQISAIQASGDPE
ncbi:MAG: Tim44 domain-containing protein [Arenimonas sp.]|nr:Tim44 domain-containing protein [Rhizobium sp.]MBW8447613.1 Tim44 domain-containing protein [Arenimonas sp.]